VTQCTIVGLWLTADYWNFKNDIVKTCFDVEAFEKLLVYDLVVRVLAYQKMRMAKKINAAMSASMGR
jgi:hypothetical protein